MSKVYRENSESKIEMDYQSRPYEYKRYKFIIENIKDVIWEMDTNFVYTFVSPNVKDMTGFEDVDLVGRRMPDFLVEESRNYIYDLAIKHGDKKIEMVLEAVQFVCKNGYAKWIEVSSKPIFEDGVFVGYIGTTRDVTEKKEYEGQLNKYINDLKVMNAKLEEMATVDALTGAYNRRKFDDDLNTIIRQQERYSISFSLVLFDIDNFKNINDCFGHNIGDHVLQCVSRLVITNIRATDSLFRWGGEEFILILPQAKLNSAQLVAEKIRELIQNHDFGIGHNITVSLGVGEYKPNENKDQIIIRIDNALLTAKSRGKNKVIAC